MLMAKQTLQFHVDAEFITNIAREWFWDENRPYEKSEELLACCLMHPDISDGERRRIIQDVIEGRKKLVGIDKCHVEEDGENIRPITLKLKQVEKKRRILEIQRDMEINGLKYIDPYCTVRSIKALETARNPRINIHRLDDLVKYFGHEELYGGAEYDDFDELPGMATPTRCGLWLIEEPELVYEIETEIPDKIGSHAFWEMVFIKTQGRNGFSERNNRYLASVRANDCSRKVPPEQYAYGLTKEDRPQLYEQITPDDIKCWEGLVSPSGDFYSCEFGGHNAKAYNILRSNPTAFGFADEEDTFKFWDTALDILIEKGWAALRYLPYMGRFATLPEKVTREQKDTIWDAIIKFDVRMEIPEQLM